MSDIIRANYDELENIAKRFDDSSQVIEEMLNMIKGSMQNLEGEWIGRGSEAFFAEMKDEVLPAVMRLQNALTEAAGVTRKIVETVRGAEEEAAGLFRGGPVQ
ncbi:MAG: WXG100 family type VII secretion target [Anaerolineales bacterium]|nr:WXG100 family type VII secretion target [Anaerolineales bacterium]MCB9126831.1 WXG100 family type VII secretion target [Ardenticatenales bacterium]